MDRRQTMMLPGWRSQPGPAAAQTHAPNSSGAAHDTPDKILLKDYRPRSIYEVPKTDIKKAKYPIIDVHRHGVRPSEQIEEWVKTMDTVGVERTVIFTGLSTPERFAEARQPHMPSTPAVSIYGAVST